MPLSWSSAFRMPIADRFLKSCGWAGRAPSEVAREAQAICYLSLMLSWLYFMSGDRR